MKAKYNEGHKARRRFDNTMRMLFSVPKEKVDAQKPVRKRASGKSGKASAKP